MKKLKLLLSLIILVFATTASFSQQTEKSKTDRISGELPSKQAYRGKPKAVKQMQDERNIGQGRSKWAKEKKDKKNAVKNKRKSRKGKMKKDRKFKKGEVKGRHGKVKNQQPAEIRSMPKNEDRVMRSEKKKGEVVTKKQRSRKSL